MIHWGFIGCGAVTEKKSGPAFSKVSGSDVVAVMRRDAEKAKEYAFRHGIKTWYDDADQLINDPQVNAVYIATPPGSHEEYAVKALRAGKPVYLEKPMAASFEECVRINHVSMETGIPCFVAYYRRTLPYFLKVKKLMEDGRLGEIATVNISLAIPPYEEDFERGNLPWRVRKDIAGAGYFYDLASHQFDLLDYLFGEISNVTGFTNNAANLYEVEDSVVASFQFKSGVIGSGSWCFVTHGDKRTDRINIVGAKGQLSFASFDFAPIELDTSEGVLQYLEDNPENIQYYLIESIINYLNGGDQLPVSTGVSAARTNWVMDKILGKI